MRAALRISDTPTKWLLKNRIHVHGINVHNVHNIFVDIWIKSMLGWTLSSKCSSLSLVYGKLNQIDSNFAFEFVVFFGEHSFHFHRFHWYSNLKTTMIIHY